MLTQQDVNAIASCVVDARRRHPGSTAAVAEALAMAPFLSPRFESVPLVRSLRDAISACVCSAGSGSAAAAGVDALVSQVTSPAAGAAEGLPPPHPATHRGDSGGARLPQAQDSYRTHAEAVPHGACPDVLVFGSGSSSSSSSSSGGTSFGPPGGVSGSEDDGLGGSGYLPGDLAALITDLGVASKRRSALQSLLRPGCHADDVCGSPAWPALCRSLADCLADPDTAGVRTPSYQLLQRIGASLLLDGAGAAVQNAQLLLALAPLLGSLVVLLPAGAALGTGSGRSSWQALQAAAAQVGGSDVQLLVSLSAQLLVGLSSGWHFLPDGLRSNVALCVVHRLVSPAVGGATASAVSAAAATAGEGGGGPGAALLWPDLLVLCDPGCLWLRRLCARGPASKALAAAVAQGGSTAQALVNAAVRAAAESDLTRADAPAALRRVLLIHVFGCALASSSVMRSLPGSAPDAFMRQLVRAVAPDADDDDKNSGRGSRGGGGGGPLVEQSCAAAAEHLLLTSSLWPGHFTTAIVGEALVACEQRLRRVAAGIRAGADSFAGSVWVVSSLAAPLLQLCSAPGGPALLASCWDHVCSSSHAACDCLAACGPEWSQDAAEGVCDVISLACRILAASPPLGETQDDGPNRRPPLAAHILAAVLTCMQSSPPRVVEHAMAALQPLATSASGVALLASSAPQAVPPLAAWLVNSLTTRPGAAVDSTGGGRDIPGQEASGRDAADSAWSSARDVDSLLATASFVALIPSGFAALVAAGLFEALLRPVLALLRAGEESRVLLQLAGPRDAPQLAPLLRLQHFCSWQGAARQLASYNLSAGPGTASSGVSGEGGTMLDALLLAGAATVTPTQPGASSAAGAAGGGMTGLEVLAAVMDPAVAASVLSADPEDTSLAVLRCMSVWATDPDALQAVASCPPLLRQLRRLVPGGTAAASAAASAQGGSLKAADSIGAATPYAAWLAQALRAPLAGREGAAFPSSATPSRQGAGAAGVLGGKAQRQQQQSQASALQRMLDAGSANGAPGSRQWLDAARAALVRDVTAGVELPPAAIWQLLPQQLPPAPPPATAAVAPPAAAEQAPPAGGAAAAAAASVALAAAALADPGPRGVEARQLPAACPELLLAQPRAASTEQLTRLVDFLSKSAPSAASEQQQLEVSQLTDVWQCVQHLAAPGQAGSSSGGRTRNRTAPADMFALVALHAVGSVSAARELLQRLSQVPAGHRLSALWPAHAQRIIGGTATLALCRLTERLLLAHAPHIFHALQASGCNAAQLVARWYRSWFCGALPVEEARGVLALAAAAEADSDVVLARVMVACFKHIDRGGALLRHAAEGTLLPWLHSLDPLEGFRLANCDVAALLGATTH